MKKKIVSLNTKLKLPDFITFTAKIKGKRFFLNLAKKEATWLVTSELSQIMLCELKKDRTIKQAMKFVYLNSPKSMNKLTEKQKINNIVSEASRLISYIQKENFFAEFPTEPYKIALSDIVIHFKATNFCNLSCSHCIESSGSSVDCKDELTTKEVEDLLDQMSVFFKDRENLQKNYPMIRLAGRMAMPEITFSGGEFLTRKDSLHLLEYAKSKGFRLSLFSNGILLDRLINENKFNVIDFLQVSIDGPEEYNSLSREKGIGDDLITNVITFAKNTKAKIRVTCLISKEHIDYFNKKTKSQIIDDYSGFVKKFEQYKNIEVKITRQDIGGRSKTNVEIGEYEFLVDAVYLKHKNVKLFEVSKKKNFQNINCSIGQNLIIFPDGKIVPCRDYRRHMNCFADVRKEKFSQLYSRLAKLNLDTQIQNIKGDCANCVFASNICHGSCRLDLQDDDYNLIKTMSCSKKDKREMIKHKINTELQKPILLYKY
ncbi:MAG: radical SAM protein [Nanoarchaeota archaeon]|nr:radical SAM protein [Nanoarchaeota archaeon]